MVQPHVPDAPGPGGAARTPLGPAARMTAAVRWGSAVLTGGGVLLTLIRYPGLPDRVPSHIDATGHVDAWSGRWSVLLLLATWVVLQIAVDWLSRRPHLLTYPVELTAQNTAAVHREGERMTVALGGGLALVLAGLTGMTLGMSTFMLVVTGLAATVGATVVGAVRILRAGRQRGSG